MATTTFGQILELDEKLEGCIQYSEQLEHFVTANDINELDRKRALLLTVI